MRIGISGSTGLVGRALAGELVANGNIVVPVSRRGRRAPSDCVFLDEGVQEGSTLKALDGLDAFVNLAGENIASGRWTEARKKGIVESRVGFTRDICRALAAVDNPPRVVVSASAVGIYGDRGGELLDERSAVDDVPGAWGADFLVGVCRRWEEATKSAAEAGIRVVNLRFGAVLSRRGGALGKMLTPFRLGLGGVVGSGEQYMSWIAIDDVAGAIEHAIRTEGLTGAVNGVSPNPVTNGAFTKSLGAALGRPTLFWMPAFAARLAFGELADALLLSSQRVMPQRLVESGYVFKYAVLGDALRHILANDG